MKKVIYGLAAVALAVSSVAATKVSLYWFYYTTTNFATLIHPTTEPAYTASVPSECNGASLNCAVGSTSYTISGSHYLPKGTETHEYYR
jgi:hypothetical protein